MGFEFKTLVVILIILKHGIGKARTTYNLSEGQGHRHTICKIKNSDRLSLKRLTSMQFLHTVKPAYAVTSIKQSPVLKRHIFLFLS